jgi:1-aminocyclopropane-1-carboxylate deaminase/D-cysteine desulfhydrase-like pyridoxal-dependent ACC family enzyme
MLPEPDFIYVPFGSMGTTAGLLLGIKAAGLSTQVKAVRVTGNSNFNAATLRALIMDTNSLLHSADPSFPLFEWHEADCIINDAYLGAGYAKLTPEAELAILLFKQLENSMLDQTYTGKAAAALINDCKKGVLKSSDVVLFWYTFCADEFGQAVAAVDEQQLPEFCRKYLL